MHVLAQAQGGAATAEVVLFWVLSVVAVGGAIAVVTFRNVVHAALMLVLNFFALAGLFLVLESSFLAIVQVIVYAGAIMVLFLFVIMLLGVSRDDLLVERDRWLRTGAWVLGIGLAAVVAAVFVGPFTGPGSVCGADAAAAADTVRCAGLEEAVSQVEEGSIGFAAERLFTRYTFAFEFVSLLLIVAIVGAVVVGRRAEPPRPRAEALGLEPLDAAGGDGQVTAGDRGVAAGTAPPHAHPGTDPGSPATGEGR